MEKSKREVATLVPYCLIRKVPRFFLQKRDMGAPTYAGYFGFFGGSIEQGETPEDAVMRETQEELLFSPVDHILFSRYETRRSINHVFFLFVDKGFDEAVTVCEGEYGAFLTLAEVVAHERAGIVLTSDLLALQELSEYLLQSTAL